VTYVHPLAPHADGIPRHPVQAYEALALVVLALALLGVPLRKDCAGLRFSIYVATYAVLRMVLETLRADDVRGVYLDARMSTSQLLSAMLLAGALAWLYRHRTRLTTS